MIKAARKADMPETEIVSINNDNFLIDQYLTKALSILIGDLLDGMFPFFSFKLHIFLVQYIFFVVVV